MDAQFELPPLPKGPYADYYAEDMQAYGLLCRQSGDAADKRDAERWRFMMRVAENPTGPEAEAMDKFGNVLSEDGNEGEQMGRLVDTAIVECAAIAQRQEGGE